MTRMLSPGRPNAGAIRFPEGIKEFAREVTFKSTGQLLRNSGLDSGGAPRKNWQPYGSQFRCNIQPVGNPTPAGITAEQINEASTHAVNADTGVDVKLSDRVQVDGRTYEVTAVVNKTGAMSRYFEVKEAVQ